MQQANNVLMLDKDKFSEKPHLGTDITDKSLFRQFRQVGTGSFSKIKGLL